MTEAHAERPSRLRTLLVLGRVSNLPTVWSNCLAGWLLTGQPLRPSFLALLAGASCLYTGGMFLNDACDAGFDRQHRPGRPIPEGWISHRAATILAVAWMVAGLACLVVPLQAAWLWSPGLAAAIVLYNLLHKRTSAALPLMGACRTLLYLVAAAAGGGAAVRVMLPALALGAYVLGISLVARHESRPTRVPRWPVILLMVPLLPVVRLVEDSGRSWVVVVCLAVLAWHLAMCFRDQRRRPDVSQLVSGLIAGIILVDLLFVMAVDAPRWSSAAFAVLLALALLLQRRVPAT